MSNLIVIKFTYLLVEPSDSLEAAFICSTARVALHFQNSAVTMESKQGAELQAVVIAVVYIMSMYSNSVHTIPNC
jgi:hypothetical protein